MAINQVSFAGQVLLDLTQDTVSPEKLLLGETAHAKNGNKITGNLKILSVHSGTQNPAANLGEDGDIYLKG